MLITDVLGTAIIQVSTGMSHYLLLISERHYDPVGFSALCFWGDPYVVDGYATRLTVQSIGLVINIYGIYLHCQFWQALFFEFRQSTVTFFLCDYVLYVSQFKTFQLLTFDLFIGVSSPGQQTFEIITKGSAGSVSGLETAVKTVISPTCVVFNDTTAPTAIRLAFGMLTADGIETAPTRRCAFYSIDSAQYI